VRVTHWITAGCFAALLISGAEIVISHPRFYWGETGNVRTPAAFELPIPASRGAVQTGYNFVLPDQNGWSRSLHFQTAWLLLFTGAAYVLGGALRRLLPTREDWKERRFASAASYNAVQKTTYLGVVFALFPFLIWTGLAMSPAITSALPWIVTALGGHQSARTLHFFASIALAAFVAGHIAMVIRAGFRERTRAMITGRGKEGRA
jgi:thiosulfate reductase cytochrome b subunit